MADTKKRRSDLEILHEREAALEKQREKVGLRIELAKAKTYQKKLQEQIRGGAKKK